ncbi:MAG: rod shape-determining protein MreC [Bacilli bacterium]|nr:rod shape-determining protein MreC [Bacilli bacterium]
MKKKKKRDNKTKKKLILMLIFLSLIFSYFEFKNDLNIGGVIKDLVYYPTRFTTTGLIIEHSSEELISENRELKRLLEIDYSLKDYKRINASLIFRNNNYWFVEFTINKGLNDGIRDNMAVVGDNGLIGKIKNTSFNTSTVKLITDIDSISVKINDNNKVLYSVNNELIIKGINDSDDIKIGDKVLTSGLSDIFPEGIIIGEILSFDKDLKGVGKTAKVKLSQDINNIKFVSVLKRYIK